MKTAENVDDWLQANGLEALASVLSDADVDLPMLLDLTSQELVELGISFGNRKRLMSAIELHRNGVATSVPAIQAGLTPASSLESALTDSPLSEDPHDEAFSPLKLFLSYGRDTYVDEVRALKIALELRGHQVWFDEEQLGSGRDWEMRIEQGLAWCDRVVLTMTPHSVRRPDGYCLNEIAKALERQKLIIPVLLVDVPDGAPTSICRIQYLDWRDAVPAAQKVDRFRVRLERLCQAIERDLLDFEGGQQRLLRALRPLNYASNIERHVSKFRGRVALLERIRQWVADPAGRQIFWLRGGPGLGKSAVAASLAHGWGEVGAVHFCESSSSDKRDASRAVLSIAYQLSTHLDTYRERLSRLDLERETVKDAITLFNNLLVDLLARNFPVPSHPWVVVIDALDEATQTDGSNPLADLIAHHWAKLPCWLRLMVSSRPDMEVVNRLQSIEPVEMLGSDPEQQADLKTYVEESLREMSRESEAGCIDRILARSEGSYEYVVRLLEDIRDGRCDPNNPVDLPRGLNGIYIQSFRRRFPSVEQYLEQCRPLLELILGSPEPVPLQILANVTGQTVLQVRNGLARLGSMLSQQPAQTGWGAQWGTVAPSHASLRTWLTVLDSSTQFQLAGDFAIEADAGVSNLAAEVLRCWDEGHPGKVGTDDKNAPQRHEYVCRTVWGMLAKVNMTSAMDRVALDISMYWEHRELELAFLPGKHAALVGDRDASAPGASAEVLERAVNGIHQLGDLHKRMGNSSKALEIFENALVVSERLSNQNPANAELHNLLRKSFRRIGNALLIRGEPDGAFAMHQKALVIAERLATEDSANVVWQKALAKSYYSTGRLLLNRGDIAGALILFRKGHSIVEGLAERDKADAGSQRELGVFFNCIGSALQALNDFGGALAMFEKGHVISERLTQQYPGDENLELDLSYSLSRCGKILESGGDLAGALAKFKKAHAIDERLAEQDPVNAEYQRNLKFSCENIAYILKSQHDLAGALAMLENASSISERLAEMDPENKLKQRELACSRASIASLEVELCNLENASAMHAQAESAFASLRNFDEAASQFDWAAVTALGAEIAQASGHLQRVVLLQDQLIDVELRKDALVGNFRNRFLPMILKHLDAAAQRADSAQRNRIYNTVIQFAPS